MKKIILVEDDQNMLLLYKDRLTAAGYIVQSTAIGEEVVPLLKQVMPQLVVLDIMILGRLNGLDVLAQIKKDPHLKRIPIIVLTNLNAEEKTARELGANEYLMKPNITVDEVIERVKRYVH